MKSPRQILLHITPFEWDLLPRWERDRSAYHFFWLCFELWVERPD